VTNELVAAFQKQTGIQVRVHTNDGIVLADQLLQEGSASPADVYLTENSPELVTIDEHKLFAKLDQSTLAQVPSRYQASSGRWVGIARRISALAYDPARVPVATLPKSILELAQPEWKGKIAIADRRGLPAARRSRHRPIRQDCPHELADRPEAQRPALSVG
jgi:iron(III) transport system substrate-binding protein